MTATSNCLIRPGAKVDLRKIKTDEDGGLSKPQAEGELAKVCERLFELQALMYAERRHALLVVLQAMDTGGKDSTIRAIFSGMNPQGCRVTSFKAPHELERMHDFLWRVHAAVPPLGDIGIFNRSHYEDVLIVRVHKLVPEKRWKARYGHINAFEEMLHDEGVTIRKFFLHISKDYQKERLQRRLDDPEKHWKFNPDDLKERARWNDYQEAYEEALSRCSTKHAPWFVIPAENRPFRNLLVARALVEALEGLNMKYPEPTFDAADVRIV
ncbi:MAG: Polyphosphate:AMP/ADP phosphotransferase [Phycisphaerae bacterium]|nr:Polyphosphate:AMP/ADP phosphotransferase [Phycisphaerae bacterium]